MLPLRVADVADESGEAGSMTDAFERAIERVLRTTREWILGGKG